MLTMSMGLHILFNIIILYLDIWIHGGCCVPSACASVFNWTLIICVRPNFIVAIEL